MVDHLSKIRNHSMSKMACVIVPPNEYSSNSNLNANRFITLCAQQVVHWVEYKNLPLMVWISTVPNSPIWIKVCLNNQVVFYGLNLSG